MNFGFTAKRSFERSHKVHECNWKQIPRIEQIEGEDEEDSIEHVQRRVVAGQMGKCQYVSKKSDANPSEGKFETIPREEIITICSHSSLHSNPARHSMVLRGLRVGRLWLVHASTPGAGERGVKKPLNQGTWLSPRSRLLFYGPRLSLESCVALDYEVDGHEHPREGAGKVVAE